MVVRRLLLAAAVAAFAVGALSVLEPGLVPVERVWSVRALGVVALLLGYRAVRARRGAELDQVSTPDPERAAPTTTPGDDFDRTLSALTRAHDASELRGRIRTRVEGTVSDVLARDGRSGDAVRERLAADVWTDDAFLADGTDRPTSSIRDRLRLRLVPDASASFVDGVRRAVAVTAEYAGLDAEEDRERDPVPDRPVRTAAVAPLDRSTGRWRGVSALVLVGVGAGALTGQPVVVLVGVVGIGFAAFAQSSRSQPIELSVERSLDASRPEPGDEVTVTVTVENEGERSLSDLRLVDGVPEALPVSEGSPRLGVALRPGKRATFSYVVEARRGEHAFDPLLVVARDSTGDTERTLAVEAESALVCAPSLRETVPLPLAARTAGYAGRIASDVGGPGIEFHAVREYRHGDPMNRIDWNRRARTGALSTVEFREERDTAVVLVVDARRGAYLSPDRADDPAHAVDRSVDAAGRLFATLTDAGFRTGITALGPEACWLEPDVGDAHRERARELLATHPGLPSLPREREFSPTHSERHLRQQLDGDAHVVFLSPLCDGYASLVARRLDAYGYPVTVVSPDPTDTRTTGQLLARIERDLRLGDLRSNGLRVLDWDRDDSFTTALVAASRRWSP